MGLDIRAYSHINIVGTAAEYNEALEESWETPVDVNQDWISPHFPHAVPEGYEPDSYILWHYTAETEDHGFRAGSYSGYGLFRSTIAGAFLGTDDLYTSHTQERDDWDVVYKSVGMPFYELVNFSDCEGIFFGPVCEKLYQDFVTHRAEYEDYVNNRNPYPAWETEYFMSRYDDFTRAFDLARHDGLVSFH